MIRYKAQKIDPISVASVGKVIAQPVKDLGTQQSVPSIGAASVPHYSAPFRPPRIRSGFTPRAISVKRR